MTSEWITPPGGVVYVFPDDWLPTQPEPRQDDLLAQALSDLRNWWSAQLYGDITAQLDFEERLMESAGRWIGATMKMEDDDD